MHLVVFLTPINISRSTESITAYFDNFGLFFVLPLPLSFYLLPILEDAFGFHHSYLFAKVLSSLRFFALQWESRDAARNIRHTKPVPLHRVELFCTFDNIYRLQTEMPPCSVQIGFSRTGYTSSNTTWNPPVLLSHLYHGPAHRFCKSR